MFSGASEADMLELGRRMAFAQWSAVRFYDHRGQVLPEHKRNGRPDQKFWSMLHAFTTVRIPMSMHFELMKLFPQARFSCD